MLVSFRISMAVEDLAVQLRMTAFVDSRCLDKGTWLTSQSQGQSKEAQRSA